MSDACGDSWMGRRKGGASARRSSRKSTCSCGRPLQRMQAWGEGGGSDARGHCLTEEGGGGGVRRVSQCFSACGHSLSNLNNWKVDGRASAHGHSLMERRGVEGAV